MDVGSTERWVTLDVTHIRDTEKTLAFIEQAGSNIAHFHLSDGTDAKMHMRIGTGELDLRRIVAALKNVGYAGVWSLECFIPNNNEEQLREELKQAKTLFAN